MEVGLSCCFHLDQFERFFNFMDLPENQLALNSPPHSKKPMPTGLGLWLSPLGGQILIAAFILDVSYTPGFRNYENQ